jgi:hypothetical protein
VYPRVNLGRNKNPAGKKKKVHRERSVECYMTSVRQDSAHQEEREVSSRWEGREARGSELYIVSLINI